MRPMLWRLHVTLGKIYRARRLFEAAEREFSAARTLIEELASAVPDQDLRQNFLQLALAMLPQSRSSSLRRAAKQAYSGLTEREREVATLVGQGQSNREIAEALTLSERTVERHISNILNKLGFDSRAQIIAWTLKRGLVQIKQG
jgi:DNA-binding NarL/FixJ family response regulator